jgi:hypothetical protein
MRMPAQQRITERQAALQYDGTNSAAILAFANTAPMGEGDIYSIESETGGVLTLTNTNSYIGPPVLNSGDYLVVTRTLGTMGVTAAFLAAQYTVF